ncbi:MAG: dihydropyrimidinase [Bdellovibrionales bacterium]|jgi:dihydropyrimidinase|nr:dihydropyrimidinase [Bdellovibrionales bacterium]MBT3525377.1 dihydropyrimidinase [Bdellovibrionales bacterium]MBT7765987.1 dihydropyrimidinase [Bdellovibrionales bacterium]
MAILIKGGEVVTCERSFRADILCLDQTITQIGEEIGPPSGCHVIDAAGALVMPGGVDPHTHLQLPVMDTVVADDFLTGSQAAIAGGTTTFIDFAIPEKGGTLTDALQQWQSWGEASACDYSLHMTIVEWNKKISKEMELLTLKHGITSFKFYLAYKNAIMVNDEELIAGFMRCKEIGALPMVHAENGDLVYIKQQLLKAKGVTGPSGHPISRPSCVEGEATLRAITIAELIKTPLYVAHVSCQEACDAIHAAQTRGLPIIGETLPSYLTLDDSVYQSKDFDFAAGHVMSPPLRPKGHSDRLWQGVTNGELTVISTDHCPFTKEQKRMGTNDFTKIPNGTGTIEDRLAILWHQGVNSGKITPEQFVALTSTNAAKTFNLYPRKGSIQVGADADLLIFDPTKNRTISAATHHQNNDFNLFEGKNIQGSVVHTIVGGRHLFNDGKLLANKGEGRFLSRIKDKC